ncbi:hypothetical protein MBLNU459_g1718t1 [Dothideomycetes sp. NU459]
MSDHKTTNIEEETNSTSGEHIESQKANLPLRLPEPGREAKTLDVGSGQSVTLDHLGPMVVNTDGTLSRINNWNQMTDAERQSTLRVLGRRNKARLEALKNREEKKA